MIQSSYFITEQNTRRKLLLGKSPFLTIAQTDKARKIYKNIEVDLMSNYRKDIAEGIKER